MYLIEEDTCLRDWGSFDMWSWGLIQLNMGFDHQSCMFSLDFKTFKKFVTLHLILFIT